MSESHPVRQDEASPGPKGPSLSRAIEEFVQSRVLGGEWGVGHKLPSEAELGKQFNASRTVIREAIRRLQGRGLLQTINGSGTYVATARLEDVSRALNTYSVLASDQQTFTDLLELRIAIEGDAAAKVAERKATRDLQRLNARLQSMNATHILEEFAILDIDFHMDPLRLSGNELFASLGSALRDRYVRFAIDAMDAYRGAEHLRGDTASEHRMIVDAIASGDPDAARQAARRHVMQARGRWVDVQRAAAASEKSPGKAEPKTRKNSGKQD